MKIVERKWKKIESVLNLKKVQHIEVDQENHSFIVLDDAKSREDLVPYKPPLTIFRFHGDDSFVRVIKGPYGSGKSTSCCAEIVLRSCAMTQCKDGIRRSRWAIVRNTYGDLESTTYQTWLAWFKSLGNIRTVRIPRFWSKHTFNDGNGIIELELLFLALDRPDQIKKLKSLELTGVYLNEISEIPQEALTHMIGRVNKRYPSKKDMTGDYWAGIIADTNPPDIDHWLYKLFEIAKPESYVIYSQPAALLKKDDKYVPNPVAENIEHLGAGYDYYMQMTRGTTEEFVKVFVFGEYGTAIDGKHVYTNYNDDLHSVDSIKFDREFPVLITVDPGIICPAVLLNQYVKGQLRSIKEFIGDYVTVKELFTSTVKPYLYKHCDGMTADVVRDPANTDDCANQLLECGFPSEMAKTNQIDARIRAQRDFLNVLVGGQAGYIVSRDGCPQLRKGFLGHYKYKRLRVLGEEKYKDVPDKNHPYSDVHDCAQYAALEFHSESFDLPDPGYIDPRFTIAEDDRDDVTGY